VAVGAYRNARRYNLGLRGTAATIDQAISENFGPEQFVTGVLAELDLSSGRLLWHSAGHPLPLLLRQGRVVKPRAPAPGLPFGIERAGHRVGVAQELLEPGDRILLYTDGVIEARRGSDEFLGLDRLIDFVTRTGASRQPAPETMRTLMQAILAHQGGQLQDDATAMLVEWAGPGHPAKRARSPTPATVPTAAGPDRGQITRGPPSHH
jgi:serine phosphatase RsbU (regulator of sigma subunit)